MQPIGTNMAFEGIVKPEIEVYVLVFFYEEIHSNRLKDEETFIVGGSHT